MKTTKMDRNTAEILERRPGRCSDAVSELRLRVRPMKKLA